jgi:hypothetical protein
MKLLNIAADAAAEYIANIAAHLPRRASLGRILVVAPNGILTADGTYGLPAHGAWAWRITFIDEELVERVRWADGVEIERVILRHDPEDAQDA